MRILLVEDNADHRELTSLTLTQHDPTWQVEEAASGEEALRRLAEKEPYDLVFLDYSLPGRNGLEMLEEIRRDEAPPPVVMVTGRGDEQMAVEAMKGGAYDYVTKGEGYLQRLPVVARRAVEAHQLAVERKRAVEEIRQLSQFQESVIDNANVWLDVLDEKANVIIWNRAAEEISGYTREEVVGHNKIWEWLYPDEAYRNEITAQAAVIIERGEVVEGFETIIQRKDGETHIISWNSRNLLDEKGSPIGSIALGRDITARKRAERELEERRSYLESVLAGAPDAIVTLDAQHNILEWNLGAERLFGYAPQEVVGRNIDDLIIGPDANVLEEAAGLTRQILAGEGVPATEVVRYRKDGSPVDVIAAGAPILLGDKVVGVVAIYTDITERVRSEEERERMEQQLRQQERLAAVGQLAGGIAHDFNNMLTVVSLYAHQLLRQEQPPASTVSAAEIIIEESKRASKLVGQILDFSRRSPFETSPMDLKSFIEEAVRVLERTIPENIHLHFDARAEEYVIKGDPTRIQQVLVNLVVNARDAMPEGGELRIELAGIKLRPGDVPPVVKMAPGEWIRLSVSDTGTGIPPHVLDHIFEPFFTTKEPGKGIGLGLAQVDGIVAQHGGHIGVETEMGQGTTFRVYLPASGAQEQAVEDETSASLQGQGETILLVEDNENLRAGGRDLLELLGYRVLTGANGREALEVYRTVKDIDLLITDLVMPRMGGEQLLQELRRATPDLKALALTGYAMEKSREELKEAGFLDVVYKPFDVDNLAHVIRWALGED